MRLHRRRRAWPSYARLTSPNCRAWAAEVAADLASSEPADYSREAAATHETGHAVVAACYGFLPLRVMLRCRGGRYSGLVVPHPRDPMTTGGDDIGAIIRILVNSAAGYMGERGLYRDTISGAAHELAVVWYGCLLIQARYGVPAIVALRATLRECELCLEQNAEAAQLLYRTLLGRLSVHGGALRNLLTSVSQRTPEHWTVTALSEHRRYPDIEQHLIQHRARP